MRQPLGFSISIKIGAPQLSVFIIKTRIVFQNQVKHDVAPHALTHLPLLSWVHTLNLLKFRASR